MEPFIAYGIASIFCSVLAAIVIGLARLVRRREYVQAQIEHIDRLLAARLARTSSPATTISGTH